jgi:hypothetical protein
MQIKFIFHHKDGHELGDQTFENFPCMPRVGEVFDSTSGELIFNNDGINRFEITEIVYRFIGETEFLPIVVCRPN